MDKEIEVVVRGVLLDRNRILLTHKKGATNTFLPGGHIDFGEPARTALTREIKEELGVTVEVKDFLGVVEHSWEDEKGFNHEINLIFRMECEDLYAPKAPVPHESHLEFRWQPADDLASVKLEPSALIKLLPRWLRQKPNTGWGSTVE